MRTLLFEHNFMVSLDEKYSFLYFVSLIFNIYDNLIMLSIQWAFVLLNIIKLIFVGKAWRTQFLELEFHSCFLRFMTARNHMQGANLYLKYYYNNEFNEVCNCFYQFKRIILYFPHLGLRPLDT